MQTQQRLNIDVVDIDLAGPAMGQGALAAMLLVTSESDDNMPGETWPESGSARRNPQQPWLTGRRQALTANGNCVAACLA